MESDGEQQLYSDMADLIETFPKVQKELKSLKTGLNRLSRRIEDLINLQDQIFVLDQKVNLLDSRLEKQHSLLDELTTSAVLSKFDIVGRDFLDVLDSANVSNVQPLRTQLLADIAATRQLIRTSQEPVAECTTFREKWLKILDDSGIEFIRA